MFEQFFLAVQQDIKLWIFFPILCAVFRAIFIYVHNPYPKFAGKRNALWECFRFGFWWGMDLNAYVFVVSLVLVTLPGLFIGVWSQYGDLTRIVLGMAYSVVLYVAFVGKMIFYNQFHDIFNNIVFLGEKAEKNNLIDIFFHQYHGARKLALLIPYLGLVFFVLRAVLATPVIPYPSISGWHYYVFNASLVLFFIGAFYFFRYGGTFWHDDKTEWDTIPAIVKSDPFLAKATVDDLIALKMLRHRRMSERMQRSPAENLAFVKPFIEERGGTVDSFKDALKAVTHQAKGPKIKRPSHIFLVVGESYSQPYFDPAFADLHIADEGKKLMNDVHTASINTTLSGGIISRPSIVGLMLGIFDAGMELNEREPFWEGTLPTSLPIQLRKLGYETNYWYGGSLSHGNFNHFAPACGFNHSYSGTDICGPKAPRSWVGIYDHVFLNKVADMIQQRSDDVPQFHFVYTTSNHGPYKLPLKDLGFDAKKIMDVQPDVLKESIIPKVMGTFWYADRAINDFIQKMKKAYPDSLFIVTGDHGFKCSELQHTSLMRREYTFRELHSPVLMFHHRELDKDSLAGNRIGGHMNILPTLFELIAPAGFTYYSLFESLTETVTSCVTPHHWVNMDSIGGFGETHYQPLTATSGADVIQGDAPYDDICAAEKCLTAYCLQRPELLRPVDAWL